MRTRAGLRNAVAKVRNFGSNAPYNRILVARGLRAFGDGYVSLLLPLYLLELGFGAFDVGVIATATLMGSGLLTLLVGLRANGYHYRTVLLAAAILMAATGVGFALFTQFWPLLLIAVVGTLNPSSGDVSVFLPLEHAVLSRFVTHRNRTAVFARYSLVGSLLAAVGALAAALPAMIAVPVGISLKNALQLMFVLYGALGLLAAMVYRGLPAEFAAGARQPSAPLGKSKRLVYLLAGLFSLDAFGGGFVVQSLIALWLYQRFGLSLAVTGTVFFWTGVLTALSYLVAVRIAQRFGLINTMVFTHLPSSVCLIAIPFMTELSSV
ncbi:MAG TPA: MFS transporter, partial [Burkholderiaceae bacterium]|nr:MFS transporter [Burkholderiaceae bacterium]